MLRVWCRLRPVSTVWCLGTCTWSPYSSLPILVEDCTMVRHVVEGDAAFQVMNYGSTETSILYCFSASINNPNDSVTWEKMAAIKSNILKRWDTAAAGIRICCIKFVQRVVQVQTPGVIADPRVRQSRPEYLRWSVYETNSFDSALIKMRFLLLWYLETIP